MTIEEKMEHFRMLSLKSANNQSAESISNYKQALDEELEEHKETAVRLSEESKQAHITQVSAALKKDLTSAQMLIKKDLTQTQAEIKVKVFDIVRDKIMAYRKTPEYVVYLTNQIRSLMQEYSDFDITIYIDPDDSALLDDLIKATGGNIEIYDKEFLGGTRTIVPEKNILVDNSFKTRFADEQEQFTIM